MKRASSEPPVLSLSSNVMSSSMARNCWTSSTELACPVTSSPPCPRTIAANERRLFSPATLNCDDSAASATASAYASATSSAVSAARTACAAASSPASRSSETLSEAVAMGSSSSSAAAGSGAARGAGAHLRTAGTDVEGVASMPWRPGARWNAWAPAANAIQTIPAWSTCIEPSGRRWFGGATILAGSGRTCPRARRSVRGPGREGGQQATSTRVG
mmetsp:Transcript_75301/g.214173  ORF Transcript_75301/g.214173 Transcript_75301/m.214173 type:complete len:217 (-) Transcript_75301:511-1161(-)